MLTAILKSIVIYFTSFLMFAIPGLNGANAVYSKWSDTMTFERDYAVELEKTPGKDFVVLNLADIQLKDGESFGKNFEITKATVARLIEEKAPDLITLSGDNAWGSLAYVRLVDMMESFGIPWAPVMGNHDGQNTVGELWCAKLMTNAEHCLFKLGPEDMGHGNYIINITENGEIIHTLYMMDTHSSVPEGGYDHLWDNQIEWYKWAVNGIADIAGKTVESTVIMHIPAYEYRDAWEAAYDEETGTFRDGYNASGVNREGIYSPDNRTPFFAVAKELGSTKNMLVGHDHVNNFSINWEGIQLSYSLKCGPGCYWDTDLNGGTLITVNSDGNATVSHAFVDPATLSYGIKLF